MKTVTLACDFCGVEFERKAKEHKRNQKIGRNTFCSLSCSMKYNHDHGKMSPPPTGMQPEQFKKHNRRGANPYNYYKGVCHKLWDISEEYFWFLWKEQNGSCAVTGLPLVLAGGTRGFADKDNPLNASIDRIDNDLGYIEGNVRFVCRIYNYCRNSYDEDVVKEWILAAARNL